MKNFSFFVQAANWFEFTFKWGKKGVICMQLCIPKYDDKILHLFQATETFLASSSRQQQMVKPLQTH
jgi:hypothetical protein